MIFPLQELIEYDSNMYEITSAASRRSYQLSMLRDPEIDMNDGKVVSLAARQIFTGEVEFRIEEDDSAAYPAVLSPPVSPKLPGEGGGFGL
jgi:DNA-directed RNA polymerase subunit omega